jgi:hypothetical protein
MTASRSVAVPSDLPPEPPALHQRWLGWTRLRPARGGCRCRASPIIPGTQGVPGLGEGLRETQAAILSNTRPENLAPLHLDPAALGRGRVGAATAFSHTYWVAWALVVLTLVPALMLPRKQAKPHLVDEGVPPAVVD